MPVGCVLAPGGLSRHEDVRRWLHLNLAGIGDHDWNWRGHLSVRAAAVEGFRGVAIIAKELILGRLLVLVEVVVKGLGVGELLLPAFLGPATLNVVNHEEFILRDLAAWALALAAVFNQDTLANTACALSGPLSSCSFAVVFVRGVFLCIVRTLTVTFVLSRPDVATPGESISV
jgi:hypothetical protein